MERIKQALERARNERAQDQEPPTSDTGRSTEPTPLGLAVQYTQTRIVEISEARLRRRRILSGKGSDAITDIYKVLRTRVLTKLRVNGWNAMAITSPCPGDGKTLTAINLAINLAREVNHTVLLGDLDLRNPQVHRYFGYQPANGISDYLLNDAPLSDVLFNPGIDKLVVLPGREGIIDSTEVLSSPKMIELVDQLKSRYPSRVVVFDLPPLLSSADVLAFSPYVDGVLRVVHEGKTRRDEVARSLELLADVPLLGCVLNASMDDPSPY